MINRRCETLNVSSEHIEEMKVAVFADVHGRLLLCLKVCARWQRETGEKLDLILQAGDMGTYPDANNLDRATIQHARHDPTELGFSKFFTQRSPQVEKVLRELDCNLVYVRGNHEDHQWLDGLEQRASGLIFPVDVYNRIFCLKSGEIYSFKKNDETLHILGIGRIGAGSRSPGSTQPTYIQPYEAKRLFEHKRSTPVDVLLTHDIATPDRRQASSDTPETKGGMPEIREVLNIYNPTYYFFGHVGGPLLQYKDNYSQTEVCKLTDFEWTRDGRRVIAPDSMGILRWTHDQHHSFEVVKDSWLQDYNAYSWEGLD